MSLIMLVNYIINRIVRRQNKPLIASKSILSMRQNFVVFSRKQLEILRFFQEILRSFYLCIPEDATLDEMNELSEKLKKELDKKSDKT